MQDAHFQSVYLVGLLAGHVLAWEVVANGCSRRSGAAYSPPALSDSSESNLNAAGQPRRGGPQAVASEWRS